MNAEPDRKESVIVARTLGIVFFGIMSLISIVVFLTEDQLDAFGYVLIVAAPFGMGAIGYFVGLYNHGMSSD
jgi:ABC-type Na+ efflux pump permease subunit